VSEAEHTPSLVTRILEALAKNPSMPVAAWADPVPLAQSPLLTSSEYRRVVESVVRDLGAQGKVVIVGHGSAVILKDNPHVLRVLVTGSESVRANRVKQNMNTDDQTALKTVRRTDQDRIDYFHRFYNAEWASPETYDLCVNTDNISVEQAVKLITAAASAG
jgi:cytidylate kinase